MTEQRRVAVIGTGRWTASAHLPGLLVRHRKKDCRANSVVHRY